MKPPLITQEQVTMLPLLHRVTVPPEYRDENDHMNVRHYLAIFDDAGYPMYRMLGLTPEALAAVNGGGFDLEHHLHYIAEVRVGDAVAVHVRMLKRSAKRMHYMMFMLNETRGQLAATFECVNSFADLSVRRTAPWPETTAAALDEMIARSERLDWTAPASGVMSA
jgi:acyl-CoA thioester hydrolase